MNGVVVFVLATFLGYELITRVPPTLHTPLMSGANALRVQDTAGSPAYLASSPLSSP